MEGSQIRHLTIVVVLAAALGAGLSSAASAWLLERSARSTAPSPTDYSSAPALSDSCNVYNISVDGEMVDTRAEIPTTDMLLPYDGTENILTPDYSVASDVVYYLEDAKNNDQIKSVLIDVNSGGGDPVAAEEIGKAMRDLGKPVAVVIHTEGASAAYMLSTYADKIFASQYSDVGSIGVTSSFLDQSQKDTQDGITYEQLSSGPFKDLYNPDKPLTSADKMLIERDLQIAKEDFVQLVADNRHLSTSSVEALADGSTVLGATALQDGLIDAIGGDEEAQQYLSAQMGEDAALCF